MYGTGLAAIVAGWLFYTTAGTGGPVDVVSRLQTALVESMKGADQMGFNGRYRALEPVVKATHDIPFLARFTLGKHWGSLTAEQRETMVRTFGRLSITTYAGQFDGYEGERFVVVSEKALPRDDLKAVESTFTRADGKQHRFNYVLRHAGGQWRIINIVVDGVSDLALKRAEYARVLEQEGFPALIERLEEQIRRHEKRQ